MALHDLTCQQLVEVVTDFLESSLDPEERDLFERHLAMCSWCQSYLDHMRHTISVMGHLQQDDIGASSMDAAADAFRTRRLPPTHPSGS
jgi:anti-sigma factor RsiW